MKQNIIAVDFDGTLCENKWPEIGMPNEELIEYLKKRQANGEKLILWTSRNEEQTKEAVEWCKKYGLIFDAVMIIFRKSWKHLAEIAERYLQMST